MLLGPWRALGLVDDTTRVELNLFDSFQNPSAPAGGWGSLPGYRRFVQRQQQMMQSWDEYGSDDAAAAAADVKLGRRQGLGSEEEEEGLGHVPGPRALWLRVSLSGRSYEAGPPRVYNARAKLDVDRGGLVLQQCPWGRRGSINIRHTCSFVVVTSKVRDSMLVQQQPVVGGGCRSAMVVQGSLHWTSKVVFVYCSC
jgi:hypothetical protein